MKKLLAMVLAIVLSLSMASIAFATDYGTGTTPSYATAAGADQIKPGDAIIFEYSDFEYEGTATPVPVLDDDYMSSEYFTIRVEYDRGKNLVKDVKFDDGKVVITLKEGIVERPSVANFRIKSVTLTGKKNGVGTNEAYRNKKFVLSSSAETEFRTAASIGYTVTSTPISDYVADHADNEDDIIKFNDDNGSYDTIVIDFDDKASAEVRVYKNEKFYFGTNSNADIDIVKANPDADLEFVNFVGKPSFSSNAKVEIFASEDYKYIYEIKNGKLVTTSFKYDDDAAAFTGKARTLTSYVMSDKRLKTSSTTTDDSKDTTDKDDTTTTAPNPDTGANSMVGVAVALAAVSLVAAGAVSFKKK